jgi:hypothetical protein
VVQRLKVLGTGLLIGAAFSLWAAGLMMPLGMGIADWGLVWASVMGDPIVGTAWGLAGFHPVIALVWLGLHLAPSHPVRPNPVTVCLTLIGLALWFFAGFVPWWQCGELDRPIVSAVLSDTRIPARPAGVGPTYHGRCDLCRLAALRCARRWGGPQRATLPECGTVAP